MPNSLPLLHGAFVVVLWREIARLTAKVDVHISEFAGWIPIRLGSRRVMGRGTSPYTCGTWFLRCGAWNRWWQCPPSASERLSITLSVCVGSPLWTMEGIIMATI